MCAVTTAAMDQLITCSARCCCQHSLFHAESPVAVTTVCSMLDPLLPSPQFVPCSRSAVAVTTACSMLGPLLPSPQFVPCSGSAVAVTTVCSMLWARFCRHHSLVHALSPLLPSPQFVPCSRSAVAVTTAFFKLGRLLLSPQLASSWVDCCRHHSLFHALGPLLASPDVIRRG